MVIGVHCRYLAAVVSSFVRILRVHVERYSDLGENTGVISKLFDTFLTDRPQLISETLPDRGLSDADSKNG